MKLYNREVVLSLQGGSHNRNLNDEHSDLDIKYFVLPTKDDLYESKVFKKLDVTESLDTDIQDVRRLESLLSKSNLSYLELLYSVNIDCFGNKQIEEIIAMRDEISRMNLSSLYSASMGMFDNNMKMLTNPTSQKVKRLIDDYGYNTKKAMLAYHFVNFIIKFHEQDFQDFKDAIWYTGEERGLMFEIKYGKLNIEQFKTMIGRKEKEAQLLRDEYKAIPYNEDTQLKLSSLLRDIVFERFKVK